MFLLTCLVGVSILVWFCTIGACGWGVWPFTLGGVWVGILKLFSCSKCFFFTFYCSDIWYGRFPAVSPFSCDMNCLVKSSALSAAPARLASSTPDQSPDPPAPVGGALCVWGTGVWLVGLKAWFSTPPLRKKIIIHTQWGKSEPSNLSTLLPVPPSHPQYDFLKKVIKGTHFWLIRLSLFFLSYRFCCTISTDLWTVISKLFPALTMVSCASLCL